MRVAVSGLFVRPGRVGGAEQMLYGLLDGLQAACPDVDLVVTEDSAHRLVRVPAGITTRRVHAPRGSRFAAEYAARTTYRAAGQVIFPNYFTPFPAPAANVLTVIHDLQYRHLPANFSARKRAWLAASHRLTLRLADRVVAISAVVADELAQLYGARATQKVVVIPNPVDWSRLRPAGRRPVDAPYFLSVGAGYAHKNLSTLVRAFARYRATGGENDLVLVGAREEDLLGIVHRSDTLRSLIDELGVGDRVHLLGYVPDGALGAAYAGATAVVQPSLFEGFGLPQVEALGLGVPVIASDLPVMREVTLGAAVLCEQPTAPEAWTELLHQSGAHPEQFAPSAREVDVIRATYAPEAVGRAYLAALGVAPSKARDMRSQGIDG